MDKFDYNAYKAFTSGNGGFTPLSVDYSGVGQLNPTSFIDNLNARGMLFNSTNNTFGIGSKVADVADKAADAGSKAAEGTSWFGNNGIIGGVGTAINGIANLWGAYNSFTQGKQQLDLMKEQNALMREQYETETARYNKREAERDAANADFRNTANSVYQQFAHNYETPQKRESVVERN